MLYSLAPFHTTNPRAVTGKVNTMQGTPFWMAPEVMKQKGYGKSAGATLWSEIVNMEARGCRVDVGGGKGGRVTTVHTLLRSYFKQIFGHLDAR